MQTTRTFPHFAYTSCLEHKRTHPHLHCPWHSLQTFKSYFTLFFSLNFIFNNPSSAVPCRQRWGNSDAFLKPCPRLSPLSHSRGSPGPPALPLPAKQGSHRKAHSQAQDAVIHHLAVASTAEQQCQGSQNTPFSTTRCLTIPKPCASAVSLGLPKGF